VYFLPGQDMPTPDDVFGPVLLPAGASSSASAPSSSVLVGSSSFLANSSSLLNQQRDERGYLLTEQLPLPVINDLSCLSPTLRERLEALATVPRQKRKMDREELEQVVLAVCERHYLTLQALAELLNRKPVSLRNDYLSPMVRNRALSLAFPTTPTHERQAYCTTSTLPMAPDDKA
jgi:ATP-dependent DNA helicase RecG